MNLISILCLLLIPVASPAAEPADSHYTWGKSSSGGTGKFYMGREIAAVMGHRGADWLDRPSREREEAPEKLLDALELSASDRVADIGSGTGYFTFRISPRVPDGIVYAVDIQQEMLDEMSEKMGRIGADNVFPVLGTIVDPRLPADSVDLALFVDAYHEFSHPREMMVGVYLSLRPGGRVVLVEYRAEDPDVPIKPLHKMSQEQALKEMAAVGLEWVETSDVLPRQHIMIFRKPEAAE